MEEAPRSESPSDPAVLDLEAVQSRYRIGRTKALELVAMVEFPTNVVPGMHRYPLRALEAWELGIALHGTVAEPTAPAPVIVTAPAPGRPGRRPSSSARDAR